MGDTPMKSDIRIFLYRFIATHDERIRSKLFKGELLILIPFMNDMPLEISEGLL